MESALPSLLNNGDPVPDSNKSSLVTSVVLNWRKPDMTSVCVEHLLAADHPHHEIVIVDNGSGDGSAQTLRDRFPALTVITSEENLGFSRGCNLGVRHAIRSGADFVALVNNDLRMDRQSVGEAVRALQANPTFGAVTGKIYSAKPGVLWQAGGHVSHARVMGVAHGKSELDRGQFDTPGTTGWASGAMTTFRTQAIERIGLLPEEYFFGQEEWDMSTALIRSGYEIGYVPTYVGHHSHGSSYAPHPALNSYGSARNRHLYAEKYLSALAYRAWRIAFWLHLQTVIATKLRLRATHRDPGVHARAMRLGWKRHESGRPVTLDELTAVSAELGIPSAWDPIEEA